MPVTATILLVAITVVLAAKLYMMVGEVGGERVSSLTARVSIEKYDWYESDGIYVLDFEFKVNSMSSPSSADVEDIDIRVLYEDENGDIREDIIEEAREEGNWR
ncbi:MAG: archaellin/type IV pilin N-terminal domain-containing protein [Candidatus Natronoplasma sp.]